MAKQSLLSRIVEYGSTGFSQSQMDYINGLYKKIEPNSQGLNDNNRKITAELTSDIFISPKIKNALLIGIALCLDIFYFRRIHILLVILVEYILSSMMKGFVGGIHLNRKLCTISGLLMYFGGYVFAACSNLGFVGRLMIFVISFFLLALFAPREMQTSIQSMADRRMRKYKVLRLITFTFIIFTLIPAPQVYKNIIVWVIAVQTATILPFVFKILEKGNVNEREI